jgi:hypothetical protein
MLLKSKNRLENSIIFVSSEKELTKAIDDKKVARLYWCGDKKCYDKVCEIGEAYEAFGTSVDKKGSGVCMICKKTAHESLFVARSY